MNVRYFHYFSITYKYLNKNHPFQVEYDDHDQDPENVQFAETYYRTVLDDEALVAGRIVRSPSFKKATIRGEMLRNIRNNSWKNRALNESSQLSPEIFVPTKRTIFTVQTENKDICHARATPTFVDSQSEENLSEKRNNIVNNEKSSNLKENSNKEDTDKLTNQSRDKEKNDEKFNEKPKIVLRDLMSFSLKSLDNQDNSSDTIEKDISVSNLETFCDIDRNDNSFDNTSNSLENSCSFSNISQLPTTSPPVESKRRVLQAVNDEGEPTVRNMIQAYNQRITENQELLISPFKDTIIISNPNSIKSSPKSPRKLSPAGRVDNSSLKINSTTVPKSQSTCTMQSIYLDPISESLTSVTRSSSSGPLFFRNFMHQSNIPSTTAPITAESTNSLKQGFPQVNIQPHLYSNVEYDTSTDVDLSLDDSSQSYQEQISLNAMPSRDSSPPVKLRAVRIKKAKEEFLARGVAPLSVEKRLSGEFRLRSGTASTEGSSRDSSDMTGFVRPSPSPSPQPLSSKEGEGTTRQPSIKRTNIPKKESFRRQSEGCLPENVYIDSNGVQVVKSASSGIIGFKKQRQSSDFSQNSQKLHHNLPVTSSKSAKNLFRFFKKSKSKQKDNGASSAVGKLCRQSLVVVDLKGNTSDSASSASTSRQNSSSQDNEAVEGGACNEAVEGGACNEAVEGGACNEATEGGACSVDKYRASSTLPRGRPTEASSSSTRSCPSSPVAPHKNRATNWLAKGRQIFKNRSPSPSKKSR